MARYEIWADGQTVIGGADDRRAAHALAERDARDPRVARCVSIVEPLSGEILATYTRESGAGQDAHIDRWTSIAVLLGGSCALCLDDTNTYCMLLMVWLCERCERGCTRADAPWVARRKREEYAARTARWECRRDACDGSCRYCLFDSPEHEAEEYAALADREGAAAW